MAGAYQPDTCISFAIFPMLSPNECASSVLKVFASIIVAGRPIEPFFVKLLFIDEGPSQSTVCTFPILPMATV